MCIVSFRAQLSALVTLAVLATPSFAQQQPVAAHRRTVPVDSGTSIRVRTTNGQLTQGRLIRQLDGSVLLGQTDRRGHVYADTVIRTSDIAAVEQRFEHRHALAGLGIGAGAGALLGVALAGAACAGTSSSGGEDFCGLGFILIPPTLAAAGGAVGLLAGALRVTTRWEPVASGR